MVKGSPRFEIADLVAIPRTANRPGPGAGWTSAEALFSIGVRGTSGTGADGSFTPLAVAAIFGLWPPG